MRKIFIFLFISFTSFITIYSQVQIVVWDFSGQPGDQTSTSVSSTSAGFTGSAITRGTGISATAGANSMNSTGWTTSTSINANDYYLFSITTPSSGAPHNISSISFNLRASGSGPTSYEAKRSIAGGSESLISSGTGISTSSPGTNITLPETTGLNNSVIVSYKIYGYNASSAAGTLRLQGSIIALPVSFNSVYVIKEDNNTKISFTTASETNNDYFTIERSADGRNFEAIGMIKGAGNSSKEINYEFTDEKPLSGINYYRIKQTDFDGQYSYSEIRSVRFKGTEDVNIYPKSTTGRLTIDTEMEDYNVQIFSLSGQEVQRYTSFYGIQDIDVQALKTGIYFVKIVSGIDSHTLKIVKL